MRNELQSALHLAGSLPADELPRLLGELEEVRTTALARLSTPATPAQPDQLLDIEQAAVKLSCSRDYLYRHSSEFPFTRRLGRKVLFSSVGIEDHLRHSRS